MCHLPARVGKWRDESRHRQSLALERQSGPVFRRDSSRDKEAGQLLGDLIDRTLERIRMKMHSIAKDAALRVIPSFDELKDLARRQDFITTRSEPPQVGSCHQRRARIGSD